MNAVVCLLLLVSLSGAAAPAGARNWTDRQGRVVTARFVRVFDDKVALLRGQKVITVPLSELCDADVAYIRDLLANDAGGADQPAATGARTDPSAVQGTASTSAPRPPAEPPPPPAAGSTAAPAPEPPVPPGDTFRPPRFPTTIPKPPPLPAAPSQSANPAAEPSAPDNANPFIPVEPSEGGPPGDANPFVPVDARAPGATDSANPFVPVETPKPFQLHDSNPFETDAAEETHKPAELHESDPFAADPATSSPAQGNASTAGPARTAAAPAHISATPAESAEPPLEAEPRIWTDISGRQIKAQLMRVVGTTAYLKHNGVEAAYRISGFSKIDAEYLTRISERERQKAAAIEAKAKEAVREREKAKEDEQRRREDEARRLAETERKAEEARRASSTAQGQGEGRASTQAQSSSQPYETRSATSSTSRTPTARQRSNTQSTSTTQRQTSKPYDWTDSSTTYRCNKCGKSLPKTIKAGEHCPHCGAYFTEVVDIPVHSPLSEDGVSASAMLMELAIRLGILAGVLTFLTGLILIVVAAFRTEIAWGLSLMVFWVLPPVWLLFVAVFCLKHWNRAWVGVLVMVAGVAIVGLSFVGGILLVYYVHG
ncbi:MAG: SHD1 domain-containing protein [Planctomycetota bacterium]